MKKGRKLFVFLSILFLVAVSQSSLAEGESQFIDVNGFKVHYNEFGSGTEAVVFIHGWTCDISFWNLQADYFKDKAHLFVVDLPGHGKSDKPKIEYTMDYFVESVKAILDHHKMNKAVLVGHSMGVSVARLFYRKYPGFVEGIVDVDAPLTIVLDDNNKKRLSRFMSALKGPQSKEFLPFFLNSMFVKESDPKVKKDVIAKMLSAPQHVRISSMENLWKPEVWEENKINVPVLVIRAKVGSSPPNTPENVKSIAADSTLEIWDGVGHFLHLEKPDKFNKSLHNFLKRIKFIK